MADAQIRARESYALAVPPVVRLVDQRPLRVARYLRVSRLDQNPRLQEDETAAFIERRGWKLVDTFVDHGVSGSR